MIHFILTFISILLTTKIVGVYNSGWLSLFLFTLILTVLNSTIVPIIKFLTWPINLLTLGLFHFALNVFVLWVVSLFVSGFAFSGFMQIAIFAIVLSIVEWAIFKFEI